MSEKKFKADVSRMMSPIYVDTLFAFDKKVKPNSTVSNSRELCNLLNDFTDGHIFSFDNQELFHYGEQPALVILNGYTRIEFKEEYIESSNSTEPPSPASDWQKEAEEMKFPLSQSNLKAIAELKYPPRPGKHWVRTLAEKQRLAFINGYNYASIEHTAHLAQLQGEIDVLADGLTQFIDKGHLLTEKGEQLISDTISRLRTITQTQPQDKK